MFTGKSFLLWVGLFASLTLESTGAVRNTVSVRKCFGRVFDKVCHVGVWCVFLKQEWRHDKVKVYWDVAVHMISYLVVLS